MQDGPHQNFRYSKLEHNIASKRKFMTSRHVDSKSREVSLAPDIVFLLIFFWKIKVEFKIKLITFAARQRYSTIHAVRDGK